MGGYRFIHGSDIARKPDGTLMSATAELFHFTDYFIDSYMPDMVELGRSFVQPMFQPTVNFRKGMYSLDNLWDGLGAIAIEIPTMKYFFGKITMYPQMNRKAKDYILYFYQKHFPDREGLVRPFEPMKIQSDYNELVNLFNGRNYKEDYQILVRSVRELDSAVPPLVNAYMNLSSTMMSFGTAINHEFGGVDETGILITLQDIYPAKKERHLNSYEKKNNLFKRLQFFATNRERRKVAAEKDKENKGLFGRRQAKRNN